MSLWRQFTSGLRALSNRETTNREIADEVSHYLEECAKEYVARGLSPAEARRAARLELGSESAVWEQIREFGWENMVETFFGDLRYALRRLGRNPGFTALSLFTLALGIGASVAIFSVVEGVLLKPLPYPESERLVALLHTAPGIGIRELNMAPSLELTYSEENRVFEKVAMWTKDHWTLTGMGAPEQVGGFSVSSTFLSALRVAPVIGRGFSVSDEDPSSPRTAILSDGYWTSRFGRDPSVLGRRILLDGNATTIIGVLPLSFRFMDRPISLVLPLRFSRASVRLIQFCCQGIARLRPGVTLAQANADVARMLPLAPAKFPMNTGLNPNLFTDARIAPRLRTLKDAWVGDVGNTLWVLMGTVGILLAIAFANVANLMLVRADGRKQELATRAALGAGRWRLARELLLESSLISFGGGALGLAIGYAALQIFAASGLAKLPRIDEISIDPAVLAFTAVVSAASGLLFGLIPVLRYTRSRGASGLRGGGRSHTGSRERHRARGALVSVQVALTLVLLVGAGLMIRTALALRHLDPGFSGASEIETFRTVIPDTQLSDPDRITRMQQQILGKLAAPPGVSKVAMISWIPMDGGNNDPVYAKDRVPQERATPPIRRFKFISPGYVSTIGSRLLAGRDLTWTDLYDRSRVALVSENMAREIWQDPAAAVGKWIRPYANGDWREVIGVVADMHDDGIDQPAPGIVYWPLLMRNFYGPGNSATSGVAFVIRTPRAGTAALLPDLQKAVASVNPTLPAAEVKTLESLYETSLARTSVTLLLLLIAGCMALILRLVGIYGTISYIVSQRTREVGIRIALGSPLPDVIWLFVRYGLMLSGIGVTLGLAVALALTRLMKSLLFGVNSADPLTYLAALVGLIVAAFFASYLPARRATTVDPAQALRAE